MIDIRHGVLCAALLVSACASAAPPLSTPASIQLRAGVVLDSSRRAVYAGRADGMTEAVAIADGRSLWTTRDAALPLAFDGRLLLARGEADGSRLPVVILDADAGGDVVQRETIELPKEVVAAITDGPGRSFRTQATVTSRGFLLEWTYRELLTDGIRPPRGTSPPELRLTGRAEIEVVRSKQKFAKSRSCGRDVAVRLARTEALPYRPWQSGGVLAIAIGGRGEPLTLRRWDGCSGRPLPDTPLLKDAVVALVSADERHVLASERVGAGGPADPEYAWSIFATESGGRIGLLRRDVSAAPFVVSDDLLVHVSQPHGYASVGGWIDRPLQLVAVRLSTSITVWDRALREVDYRGLMPPTEREERRGER